VREMEGGGSKKVREGVWMRPHPTSRRHLPHPSGEPKGDPRGKLQAEW
jgi:hypothetical protein